MSNIRGEDDGLADHLARGASRDVDSVAASAGRPANERIVTGGSPATVADVALRDLAWVGVGGVTGKHTEALVDIYQ